MTASRPDKLIMSIANQTQAALWDRLLNIQVDVSFAAELPSFEQSPRWMAAGSVLDAGCGNGYYLSRFKTHFPDKAFTGLDRSPELIAQARSRYGARGLRFELADFMGDIPPGSYDAILMRFMLQHMKDLGGVLARAASMLSAKGLLILIEPAPEMFVTEPETPMLHRLIREYEQTTHKTGLTRSLLTTLKSTLATIEGWQLISDSLTVVDVRTPIHVARVARMFSLWIDVFKTSSALRFPFEAARAEVRKWAASKEASSRLGLRFYELQRLPDASMPSRS